MTDKRRTQEPEQDGEEAEEPQGRRTAKHIKITLIRRPAAGEPGVDAQVTVEAQYQNRTQLAAIARGAREALEAAAATVSSSGAPSGSLAVGQETA